LVKGIAGLETLTSTAMALGVICAFFLGFAGLRILTGRANRARGALMIAAAAVILANVLIWTI
jgi:peroxiredoxin family protein